MGVIFVLLYPINFVYLFVYIWGGGGTCVCHSMKVKVKGQLAEVCSLFVPCGIKL